MKKFNRKIIIAIVIAVVSLILLFLFSRYGWKLFGFALCDSPYSIYAESIEVEDNKVEIKGGIGDSISSFVGYVYVIEGNNLYIGVNHNALLGFFSRNGGFDISIDTDKSEIKKIYFRDNKGERVIWNIDGNSGST